MTTFLLREPRKNSLRLPFHHYASAGYYYVTICTDNREHFFGSVTQNIMALSTAGNIVKNYWMQIPDHFSHITLDEFIIMPNHIHGILVVDHLDGYGRGNSSPISSAIGSFKSICTKKINRMQDKFYFGWQRSFHDHVIRNEHALNNIRQYIRDNPLNWKTDENYTDIS